MSSDELNGINSSFLFFRDRQTVKKDFWLENALDGEAGIEVDKRMKFRRIEKALESIKEFQKENSREPKSFSKSSLTAGERKIAS
jgi:hypothetical protein